MFVSIVSINKAKCLIYGKNLWVNWKTFKLIGKLLNCWGNLWITRKTFELLGKPLIYWRNLWITRIAFELLGKSLKYRKTFELLGKCLVYLGNLSSNLFVNISSMAIIKTFISMSHLIYTEISWCGVDGFYLMGFRCSNPGKKAQITSAVIA